jgi:hypothetical protein
MRRAASMSVISALVFISSSYMLARLMFIWKACRHAKIAAAAHPSEEVGILAGAGFQELPVGSDDIDRLTTNLAQYWHSNERNSSDRTDASMPKADRNCHQTTLVPSLASPVKVWPPLLFNT